MINGIVNSGERGKEKEHQAGKPSVLWQLSQARKACAESKPPEPGNLVKVEKKGFFHSVSV